jgi:hypothetical protein
VNTDEHCFQQEAVGTLGFIGAATQYQADAVRLPFRAGPGTYPCDQGFPWVTADGAHAIGRPSAKE